MNNPWRNLPEEPPSILAWGLRLYYHECILYISISIYPLYRSSMFLRV